ncbi:MAG: hypothetical protein IKC44_05165 [Burkholderiaceae bacterium]|nr:hypothetical protein [Burkholderiaceae bacterium]
MKAWVSLLVPSVLFLTACANSLPTASPMVLSEARSFETNPNEAHLYVFLKDSIGLNKGIANLQINYKTIGMIDDDHFMFLKVPEGEYVISWENVNFVTPIDVQLKNNANTFVELNCVDFNVCTFREVDYEYSKNEILTSDVVYTQRKVPTSNTYSNINIIRP